MSNSVLYNRRGNGQVDTIDNISGKAIQTTPPITNSRLQDETWCLNKLFYKIVFKTSTNDIQRKRMNICSPQSQLLVGTTFCSKSPIERDTTKIGKTEPKFRL